MNPRVPAPLPGRLAEASRAGRTLLMGVLNVTPDSFSDGGRYLDAEAAIAHGALLAEQGADLIDVGGESTRPGAARVSPEDEKARILPVIRALAAQGLAVSADTIHAETARAAAEAGAVIINDVSGGLGDPAMHATVAQLGIPYVCQHWRGNPQTMDQLTDYPQGVVEGVSAELRERLAEMREAGVAESQIIFDPGLGFAKTHEQSWQLLAATASLRTELGFPMLIGASRKRFLAAATSGDPSDPRARDLATAATTALASAAGAWAVRVHDIPANRDALLAASLWKESQ